MADRVNQPPPAAQAEGAAQAELVMGAPVPNVNIQPLVQVLTRIQDRLAILLQENRGLGDQLQAELQPVRASVDILNETLGRVQAQTTNTATALATLRLRGDTGGGPSDGESLTLNRGIEIDVWGWFCNSFGQRGLFSPTVSIGFKQWGGSYFPAVMMKMDSQVRLARTLSSPYLQDGVGQYKSVRVVYDNVQGEFEFGAIGEDRYSKFETLWTVNSFRDETIRLQAGAGYYAPTWNPLLTVRGPKTTFLSGGATMQTRFLEKVPLLGAELQAKVFAMSPWPRDRRDVADVPLSEDGALSPPTMIQPAYVHHQLQRVVTSQEKAMELTKTLEKTTAQLEKTTAQLEQGAKTHADATTQSLHNLTALAEKSFLAIQQKDTAQDLELRRLDDQAKALEAKVEIVWKNPQEHVADGFNETNGVSLMNLGQTAILFEILQYTGLGLLAGGAYIVFLYASSRTNHPLVRPLLYTIRRTLNVFLPFAYVIACCNVGCNMLCGLDLYTKWPLFKALSASPWTSKIEAALPREGVLVVSANFMSRILPTASILTGLYGALVFVKKYAISNPYALLKFTAFYAGSFLMVRLFYRWVEISPLVCPEEPLTGVPGAILDPEASFTQEAILEQETLDEGSSAQSEKPSLAQSEKPSSANDV